MSTVRTVTPAATSARTVPSASLTGAMVRTEGPRVPAVISVNTWPVQGGIDRADIGLPEFLVPGVGPPGAVRRHDGDEIRAPRPP